MAPKTLHLIDEATAWRREPTAALPRAVPLITRAALAGAGTVGDGSHPINAAEEFRVAQRQVLRAAFDAEAAEHRPGNLAMVTSARPGEGKSFTALNLAASVARQNDYEVLLIDADGKPGSLGCTLGIGKQPGLLDLAADAALDPDTAIVGTELEKLFVLPYGRARENSSDLFASRPMARLLHDLGAQKTDRLVIVDAPPCLASSGPSALAAIVGQTVFVIESERTRREEVEASLDLLAASPLIMLLLNKARIKRQSGFGSYAHHAVPRPA